ncbi:hypothetical protein GGR52DRAFT_554022 [Hypoxylon sp. FL1284]|nr:hypothetical protein GGR52DRAFT_554022 [Hypoxylon sp. FL1284]
MLAWHLRKHHFKLHVILGRYLPTYNLRYLRYLITLPVHKWRAPATFPTQHFSSRLLHPSSLPVFGIDKMAAPHNEFKVDEALLLPTGRVRATSARDLIVKAPLEPTDLRSAAVSTAETIPEGIPFIFTRHPNREQRRKLYEHFQTGTSRQTIFKPVHVPYDTNVQAPEPPSPAQRRILASKFEENMPEGFPGVVILKSPFCEDNLPALKASITIKAVDGEDSDPTENLVAIPMLYDTGVQATVISEELLSPRFQEYLRTAEINEPYRTSRMVQVSAHICFTNTVISLDIIAVVRSKEFMPDHFNGGILGQIGAIDSLVAEMVPRSFLPHLSGEFWGEIRIARAYDGVLGEIKEY